MDLTSAHLLHDFDLSVGFPNLGECLLDPGFIDDFGDGCVPRVSVFAQHHSAVVAIGEHLGMKILAGRVLKEALV